MLEEADIVCWLHLVDKLPTRFVAVHPRHLKYGSTVTGKVSIHYQLALCKKIIAVVRWCCDKCLLFIQHFWRQGSVLFTIFLQVTYSFCLLPRDITDADKLSHSTKLSFLIFPMWLSYGASTFSEYCTSTRGDSHHHCNNPGTYR